MNRATPIGDEQLFDLLGDADPLTADRDPTSAIEQDRLLQRILSSERTRTRRPDRRRAQRQLVIGAVSGGGVAAAAVAAVLVLSAGSAPSVAFAGWRADPTVPASGQVQTAEAECQRNSALASLTPTLVDTRGPYTLLVYAESSGGLCVTGPQLQSPTGQPPVAPIRSAMITMSVAPDAIRRIDNASVIAKASTPGTTLSFNDGRIGVNVTAVTLGLADGSRVRATTSDGWFAAWWPGGVEAQTAEITTTSGTTTQQFRSTPGYETSASSTAHTHGH